MTAHDITFRTVRRAFLDALKLPTCSTCGDLSPEPLDVEDARTLARRHQSQVLAEEVGA